MDDRDRELLQTRSLRFACAFLVWGAFSTGSLFGDDQAFLQKAETAYREQKWAEVVTALEPLLDRKADTNETRLAKLYTAGALHRLGEDHFRAARIADSVEAFDREVAVHPAADPGHWQRGISYYYAKQYDKGARQFERHQTVNPQDVENAVWHFLCVVKSPGGTIEKARASFIPIQEDERVPLKEIHALFAGQGSIDAVEAAAAGKGPLASFYANLYIGLYLEAEGKPNESLEYITRAAEEPTTARHYMGDVARTHQTIRTRDKASPLAP